MQSDRKEQLCGTTSDTDTGRVGSSSEPSGGGGSGGRSASASGAVDAPAASRSTSAANTEPDDPTAWLPEDLARVLRDQAIRVPQDEYWMPDGRTLWEHLEEWRNAPSNTVSADFGTRRRTRWWSSRLPSGS
jgi:hypothetical protein